MGTIMLRDVDDEVLRSIGVLAEHTGVSVGDQAKHMLNDAVQVRDRRDLVARLEAIAAMTPKGVLQTDSTDLLREDRDR